MMILKRRDRLGSAAKRLLLSPTEHAVAIGADECIDGLLRFSVVHAVLGCRVLALVKHKARGIPWL